MRFVKIERQDGSGFLMNPSSPIHAVLCGDPDAPCDLIRAALFGPALGPEGSRVIARLNDGTEHIFQGDAAWCAQYGFTAALLDHLFWIGPFQFAQPDPKEALVELRRMLQRLADTGGTGCAEDAISILEAHIARAGRHGESATPLGAARLGIAVLERERAEALARAGRARGTRARLAVVRERIRAAQDAATRLHDELETIRLKSLEDRLHEAEQLQAQIDAATRKCFTLSAVRDFPIEAEMDVQRSANALQVTQAQCAKLADELDEQERLVRAAEERLGRFADTDPEPLPDGMFERLAYLEPALSRLATRAEQFEAETAAAQARLDTAIRERDKLPDFPRFSEDPEEWLVHLADGLEQRKTFYGRQSARLEQIRGEIARLDAALAMPRKVFQPFDDFRTAASCYESDIQTYEKLFAQLRSLAEQYRRGASERNALVPVARMRALAAGVASLLLGVAAHLLDEWGVYIPAAATGVIALIALAGMVAARAGAVRSRIGLARTLAQLGDLRAELADRRDAVDKAIAAAGYASLRELEALHERFVEQSHELEEWQAEAEAQEQKTHAAQQELGQYFEGLRRTFADLNISLNHMDEIDDALASALKRYLAYCDATHRYVENKNLPVHLASQANQARTELDAARREERDLALEARRMMRDAGFRDESRYTNVLKACAAFEERNESLARARAELNALRVKRDASAARLADERERLAVLEAALARLLRVAGAESPDHWRALASKAREYREAWETRAELKARLDALARDGSGSADGLAALRAAALPCQSRTIPLRPREEIEAEEQSVKLELETASREAEALVHELARLDEDGRSLNDIEEELARVSGEARALELERDAAAYAAAVIEEVTRKRRTALASLLTRDGSWFLGALASVEDGGLRVEPDLRIRVSAKGCTVGQTYLAIRFALPGAFSFPGLAWPVLVRDPHPAYDPRRLEGLAKCMARLAQSRQVVFLTRDERTALWLKERAGATVSRGDP